MVRPLPTDVHEARTQPFLHEAEASAHSQGALVLGAHTHLDAVQAELADDEVENECRDQGTFEMENWPTKRPSICTPKIRPVPSR